MEAKKCNDTDIVLPSSLVLFAHKNRFTVELLYAKDLGFPPEIIQEEKRRCPEGMVEEFDSKAGVMRCFSDEIKYGLVLVCNYNHWIAVKRKSENKGFSVYDPATGKCDKVDNVNALTGYLAGIDPNAGDLIITLK